MMIDRIFKILFLILLLAMPCFAQTDDVNLNQDLRYTERRIGALENAGLAFFQTPTADGVPVGDGSAFNTKVLPSCSGGTLAYNSTTDAFSCVSTNIQVFTADGNFTAPTGVTKVYLTMVGGGAGGGGGPASSGSGGGGSGGATLINYPYTVVPSSTYAVNVGVKGTGGTAGSAGVPSGDGSDGESSTFNSAVTAQGGNHGHGAVQAGQGAGGVSANVSPNASGTTAGGINTIGSGTGGTDSGSDGGAGGGSSFGAGGVTHSGNASGYGGGGGGGEPATVGGNGTDGICIVMY